MVKVVKAFVIKVVGVGHSTHLDVCVHLLSNC